MSRTVFVRLRMTMLDYQRMVQSTRASCPVSSKDFVLESIPDASDILELVSTETGEGDPTIILRCSVSIGAWEVLASLLRMNLVQGSNVSARVVDMFEKLGG